MVYVDWRPKWEAADMLRMHPGLHAHMQAFEEKRLEHTVDPLHAEVDLDKFVNQGFEGNPIAFLTLPGSQLPAAPFAKKSPLTSNRPTPRQISCQHGN
eukprot:687047-Pelagomonas_calceolata.AAC.1